MQEVYQISVIPAHKPWRGFGNYYTTDKEVFDFFASEERWIPDLRISEVPEKLRHLAVEPVYNAETEKYEHYVPNGTEDWDACTAVIDGIEADLEMYPQNILYYMDTEKVTFPFILLGTAEAYTE